MSWTVEEIRDRTAALGPWFHNMDLRGVRTAPEHFLGDYPRVKWERFRDDLPADLSGKTVLDIGCNAGFYSMEMKRRGAARVLGLDFDEDYLAQARFAADVEGLDIEFRQMSVYDVGTLGERFDVVFFIGVFYHLRHPLLALDLIHEHVAGDLLVFQSLATGLGGRPAGRARLPVRRDGHLRRARLSEDALHRAQLQPRQHQLVGTEPRRLGRDAAQRRVHDREQPGGGGVHLPPRRAPRRAIRRRLSRHGPLGAASGRNSPLQD